MTEDEAKTKWCPFAKSLDWSAEMTRQGDELSLVHGAVNRRIDGNPIGTCIGSACMAWRTVEWKWDGIPANHPGPRANPAPGFCGLAGPVTP